MSIVIVSSGDKLRVEGDHRRHELRERRDRCHRVRPFGVDGAIGGGVDDHGIERRQAELGGVEHERRLRRRNGRR